MKTAIFVALLYTLCSVGYATFHQADPLSTFIDMFCTAFWAAILFGFCMEYDVVKRKG